MRLSIAILGIVILLIGIVVTAALFSTASGLATGLILIVAGIIILGLGAGTGKKMMMKEEYAQGVSPQIAQSGIVTSSPMGGASMRDMVESLASMPDDKRFTMLNDRLRFFATQGDSERKMGMKMMLDSALDLPQRDYKKLCNTRLNVVMSLPDPDRMKLMKTHVQVVDELSMPKKMKEMETTKECVMEMPEPKRSMMMKMMKDMGMSMEMSASPPPQQVQLAQERPGQNPMKDMVEAMVTMPDDKRLVMLGDRLRSFLTMTESDRGNSMKMMLSAALDLPDDQYMKLASTRMQVLMSLSDADRMALMKTHVEVLKQLPPEKMQKEMKIMQRLLMSIPEQQRKMMMNMMKNLGMPMQSM